MSVRGIALFLLVFCGLEARPDYWRAEEYYENSSSQKNAASDLLQYIQINRGDRVLDVGCGDGKITAEIAKKVVGSVVGVDISPAMIAFAKEKFPNVAFFQKDAQALDFSEEFDCVVSFTALQWVGDHDAFLRGARTSLREGGTLAVTMPMGLPEALAQAVEETIALPQWASYFHAFSTGWNFVDDVAYGKKLTAVGLKPSRLAVVPQRDIFPSRAVFEKFIGQWFPYLRPLPQELKGPFLTQVVDRFLALDPMGLNGEVHFKIRRLEVVAVK